MFIELFLQIFKIKKTFAVKQHFNNKTIFT